MAKKPTTYYTCTACGTRHAKWSGRCNGCGEWNTLSEQFDAAAAIGVSRQLGNQLTGQSLATIKQSDHTPRVKTGISEVDLVFGGGVVPASVTLLAGEPGIGKSTLLLQIASAIARQQSVLYVTAEESLQQVYLRSTRLQVAAKQLQIVASTSTDDIVATMQGSDYGLIIVDSIQTVTTSLSSSSAGSTSQISNSAQLLIKAAKSSNTSLIIVGHVTKEGTIAGPKVLEHLVDVVLNLEGERYGGFKLLRSIKNRYGSTNEAGVFEMGEQGLKPVTNPSAALLAERQVSDGSVVLATLEGTRPLLVEVQALVTTTSFGYPKRTASGIDLNRLNLLIAMLTRRTKLKLHDKDVYINIVGGMKISEPAADLAVCMAIASAAKGMQLNQDAVVFGEVGLSGEVRHVHSIEQRVKEAQKLGFKHSIGPAHQKKVTGLSVVRSVREALNSYLSKA
jgi:DNA repair protein RadA/Sms